MEVKIDKIYWTMKNGEKIDVDEMDINHLRNTLKMIIRNSQISLKHPKSPKILEENDDWIDEIINLAENEHRMFNYWHKL